jgi:Protein of unknown function (DUF669).
MARKSKETKKSRKISVDMSGVESSKKVAEGDYRLKVTGVEKEKAESSGKDKLSWEFEITAGKSKGATLYYTTSLQPQALWNLKGLLENLGVEVPDSAMDLDLDDLVDREVGGTVEHEVYEGKKRSRLVDFMPIDDVDGEEGGDEDEGGSENNELPDADAINEMDEDELQAVIDEHELEVDLDDHKKLKAKRKAVIEAIEEKGEGSDKGEEEGEEKEEDEDGISADEVDEMDKDDMAEFVKKNKLKVELEGSTSAQRKTLKKALKKAGLLKEGEDD